MTTAAFSSPIFKSSAAPGLRRATVGRYLAFSVGGDAYGLHVKRVREIIHNVAQMTRIPQMPAYVSGCLNVRGTVIPVVDLRRKFQVEPVGNPILNCIIVCDVKVGLEDILPTGLIVDTVEEVVTFKADDLEPAPEFGGGLDSSFVQGIAKHKDKLVALLDLDKVIALATLAAIKERIAEMPPEEAVSFD